jgi:hypothetical protein
MPFHARSGAGPWPAVGGHGRLACWKRVHLVMADWRSARARLRDVHGRMVEMLDQLRLTDLVSSIDGLSAVGAAAILAETGDLSSVFTVAASWSTVQAVRLPRSRFMCVHTPSVGWGPGRWRAAG